MIKELWFEDVEVGDEISPLTKKPTAVQLVQFLAVQWHWHRVHFDRPFALGDGAPDVIVQGRLMGSFLAQMLTDWTGIGGTLNKIKFRALIMTTPADTLTCKGKIVEKYVQNENHCLDCEIWIENQKGEIVMPGSATVSLPSRK